MVKQNRTKAAKDAKSTATSTDTAESMKPPVSVQESKQERQAIYESDGTQRYICLANEKREETKELIGFDEIFQNGLINCVGNIPFSEEQINFIIDNSFEVGILVDEYRHMEDLLDAFDSDERLNLCSQDDEELRQCLKGIVKRRYAETIRAQKAAGIMQEG